MTIIFYDIPSSAGPWSCNTWKTRSALYLTLFGIWANSTILSTRYCLNLKKIPYKTEWVEYPDIEKHCRERGIQPTPIGSKGRTAYTLPAIHDTSTGVYVSDSPRIAEYLEKQYPDGPKIFPHNTIGLQIDFEAEFDKKLASLWVFVIPPVVHILNKESQEFFRTTREKSYGKVLEDIVPTGDNYTEKWAKVESGLGELAAWYTKTAGPFIMGNEPSWADFVVGGHLIWFNKAWGDNDPKWNILVTLNGGVWKDLLAALKEYEIIQ